MDFLAIGDLHLDSRLSQYSVLQDINAIIMKELYKALRYATDKGIKYVVLLGDVCNYNVMSSDAHIRMIDMLSEYSHINFIAILGNHDTRNVEDYSLKVLQRLSDTGVIRNLKVISKPTVLFRKRGTPINFMPWPSFQPKADCLNVGHIELNGAQWDHGKMIENEHDTEHLYLGGHLHTKQELKDGRWLIPGTLYQTNFGERNDKYWAHCRWDGTNFEYDLIPNVPEFTLETVIINTTEDLDKLSKDERHLYKAIIKDGAGLDSSSLAQHPNIVKTNRFKSRSELQNILADEFFLNEEPGKEVSTLAIVDALNTWMLRAKVDEDLQERTRSLFATITGTKNAIQ